MGDYLQYLKSPIENGPYLSKTGICPNGEVKYISSSQKAIYNYDYKHVTKVGFIKVTKKVRTKTHIKF